MSNCQDCLKKPSCEIYQRIYPDEHLPKICKEKKTKRWIDVNVLMTKERVEELRKRPWAKIFPEAFSKLEKGICPTCDKRFTDFRDAISEKEYTISGMCMDCQDSVFGVD